MLDLTTILLALQLSAPGLNDKITMNYAKVIQKQSIKKNIDPLIIISIIAHESHWNSRAISNDKNDYGLMQVRARFVTISPERLLDGSTNIMVGSAFLDSSVKFCTKFLNREPLIEESLSCYQGSCSSKRKMCKPTKKTKDVVDYATCIYNSIKDKICYNCQPIYD